MNKHCQLCHENIEEYEYQIVFTTPFSHVIYARNPLTQGHLIIFPKKHHNRLENMTPKETNDLVKTIQRMINILKLVYKTSSYNIFANVGPEAGQTIPHLHFHILMRYKKEKQSPFEKIKKRGQPNKKALEKKVIQEVNKIKREIKTPRH